MKLATDETMRELSECGCCEGTSAETPVEMNNRPGLSAIAYRVGTQSRILESMLAALSDADRPSLGRLKTRDKEDFSIALLDAWATVEDVLTFYQERIANESFLRTATERRSVIELVRALGYELQPGVAASTALAFTLETAAGAPLEVTIPVGTRVQSVPGPDEKPQTFETIEELDARAEWNLLNPQRVEPQRIRANDTHLFFKGTATNLKPGDALIFVGPQRQSSSSSTQWDFRRVKTVEANQETSRTLVTWDGTLSNNLMDSNGLSVTGLKIYALRQRASVFGHNAPDWRTLAEETQKHYRPSDFKTATEWPDFKVLIPKNTNQIDLDAVYQKIVKDSWLVLTLPNATTELYSVTDAREAARADFTLTGKTTRVTLSGNNLTNFDNEVRTTTVFAESEELALAEVPITDAVLGKTITLDAKVEGIEPGKKLIVTGKRMRASIAPGWRSDTAWPPGTLQVVTGTLDWKLDLFVLGPPVQLDGGKQKWHFESENGAEVFFTAEQTAFSFRREGDTVTTGKILLLPSKGEDETVSDLVVIGPPGNLKINDRTLVLESDLQNVYDRATVSIYANVASSTHGETTSEVLGNGDASRPFQEFTLRQSPLTYTSANTPSGTASTLEVRVNDLLWHEVPSLYGRGSKDRVYMTERDDAGATTVKFGDGVTGARLPTGTANVKATYRKGIGLKGDVKAGQLSLLMTRPLGVKGVTNPIEAAGAADAQETRDAQSNAPLTVLTLDRIVSLRDYEDFARSYAGISKAMATWTWNVHARGVFVTVAGVEGATVSESSDLFTNLLSAMRKSGDTNVPLQIKSYVPKTFKLAADIKVQEDYDPQVVRTQIEIALRQEFSFAARSFGQPVARSEVVAVIQSIAGVVSVNITKLFRTDDPAKDQETVLVAQVPKQGAGTNATAAELLTLDTALLDALEVHK